MPFSFNKRNHIHMFGDGNGNVVIEEYEDDEFKLLLGKVTIDVERYKQMIDLFSQELIVEAWRHPDELL